MDRPSTARLTSEERCRKAFEEHVIEKPETWTDTEYAILYWGFQLAWKYLESRVTEFIEQ